MSETLAEKMARLHDLECEKAAMAALKERARRGNHGRLNPVRTERAKAAERVPSKR